jgi:hypothetical protein
MPLNINSDCFQVGTYTEVPFAISERSSSGADYVLRHYWSESQLKHLRKNKVTYCTRVKDGENIEFPFVLEDADINDDGETLTYELTQPFEIGIPRNLSYISGNTYYGDMIYDIVFLDGYVYIYYVIGGVLELDENETWSYVDKDRDDTLTLMGFLTNPMMLTNIDDYFFLKNEMNRVADGDENSNVVYKGDVTISEDVIKPDVDGEIWLYRVMFSENDYHIGDYLIVSKQGVFHFGLNQVKHKMSSGVRFCEKKEWQLKNYEKDNSVQIKMLFSNKRTAVNILKDPTIVKNLKEAKLIDYTKMDDDVEGVYVLSDEGKTMETSKFLMMERDFGKIDAKVENLDNLILDRGYASAFEMHFKLSEVNTLEDMENYGNNFFGL